MLYTAQTVLGNYAHQKRSPMKKLLEKKGKKKTLEKCSLGKMLPGKLPPSSHQKTL